jgi:hypothetical protein
MIKKLSIDKGFVLSQKMGLLVLIGTIMFATTFAVTGHSGTANAQVLFMQHEQQNCPSARNLQDQSRE